MHTRDDLARTLEPSLMASLEQILVALDAVARVLVVAHVSPDGDAVGSTLAMGHLLRQLGKDVICYNQDPVPYNFRFLPGSADWHQALPDGWTPEATILLDCAERHRIGDGFPERGWGDMILVIDHHKSWDPTLADVFARDERAAATGELVYWLAGVADAELTADLATCLYCCLLTDTGSFRYSSTSRTTFQIAGELVASGVNPWDMTSAIYESQPRNRVALLQRVLETLHYSECGRLAFLRLEQQMMRETNTDPQMADGFINYGRSVDGVEVATQLLEVADGTWKVSFRSRGSVDVGDLARRFGGGGHRNAAGCTIEGDPHHIEAELSAALDKILA
ncbi:MAG: bifunctional oligoribonuclease/PAP phosphatase NrnA [Myxococcota bacterium]